MAWTPRAVSGSIGAGDDDGIVIRIAHPTLPVIGAAIAVGRVSVPRQHNFDAHLSDALHYCLKVFNFEPEQHTIAVGSVGNIADRAVMVCAFKAMKLQDEAAIVDELFVLATAMSPLTAQQAFIPQAAGFDIRDTDEGLGHHRSYPKLLL
jgi:hypothetical protein